MSHELRKSNKKDKKRGGKSIASSLILIKCKDYFLCLRLFRKGMTLPAIRQVANVLGSG